MTQNRATDREFLTKEEYGSDDHLVTRIRTHQHYTQPQVNFADWVLDHIQWHGDEVVLDIGCGSGMYVEPVLARLSEGGRLRAGDLSMGMLQDLAAKEVPAEVTLFNADAMELPMPADSCDVVMANHMLYHVPYISRALAEAKRVLRPGGRFLAVTNARNNMQVLIDAVSSAAQALGHDVQLPNANAAMKFRLEDGARWFDSSFPQVQVSKLDSALVFPAAEPVLAYVDSLRSFYEPDLPPNLDWEALLGKLAEQINTIIATAGEFRVPKTTGVFLARC